MMPQSKKEQEYQELLARKRTDAKRLDDLEKQKNKKLKAGRGWEIEQREIDQINSRLPSIEKRILELSKELGYSP